MVPDQKKLNTQTLAIQDVIFCRKPENKNQSQQITKTVQMQSQLKKQRTLKLYMRQKTGKKVTNDFKIVNKKIDSTN